jgi:hypothetical protein
MTVRETPITALYDQYAMSDADKAARAKAMYAMYANPDDPKSLDEVGQAFEGMSRERVRQILREHGYPIRTRRGTTLLKQRTKQ